MRHSSELTEGRRVNSGFNTAVSHAFMHDYSYNDLSAKINKSCAYLSAYDTDGPKKVGLSQGWRNDFRGAGTRLFRGSKMTPPKTEFTGFDPFFEKGPI